MRRHFINLLLCWLYPISILVPKRRNLWVLTASGGSGVTDNSRYLFWHLLNDHHTDIQVAFLTRDAEAVESLQAAGWPVLSLMSWKGISTLLRAKVLFFTHGLWDSFPFLLGGKLKYNLWHGVPLKWIGYDHQRFITSRKDQALFWFKRGFYGVFPWLDENKVKNILVPSNDLISVYRSAFGDNHRFIVNAQPRLESLAPDFSFEKAFFPEIADLDELPRHSKLITWMPTHRVKSGAAHVGAFKDCTTSNLEALSSILAQQDAVLVIKPHPIEQISESLLQFSSDRIVLWNLIDPYPLLARTDVLITDYSSILFDFVVRKNPIIFYCPDLDYYLKNVSGMYFPFESVARGPICKSWKELLAALERGEDSASQFDEGFLHKFVAEQTNGHTSASQTLVELVRSDVGLGKRQ